MIEFAPNKEHNAKQGSNVTRAGLTSAAARSAPGCKLLLSVDEVMLSHGLSLGCNKLRLSTPPQGVADSKGHGGQMHLRCQRHTDTPSTYRLPHRNQQAYLFMAGLVLSGSSSASSEPSLAAEHAAAAASCLLPCAMYSNFSISCSFSVSEAISFRPRVISIFSIFDSISTSLLISITAVLDNASMMETSCVWKEKTADMARGESVPYAQVHADELLHSRAPRVHCKMKLQRIIQQELNMPTRHTHESLFKTQASELGAVWPPSGWAGSVALTL